MITATVRQVQHHLGDVLKKVEDGGEVLITKRGRIIAKIVPVRNRREPVNWPDFIGRARQIWPNRIKGKSISSIIIEERKDRV